VKQIESESTQSPKIATTDGNVLVPLIFILSLVSLIAMSALRVGGIGNTTSEALTERSQARMAALSGVEIAYSRLATDQEYTGEQCTPFERDAASIDVSVTEVAEDEFEVRSTGNSGLGATTIRTRAAARPFFLDYPLSVGNNLILKGDSKILGECYIRNVLWGTQNSLITGSVFMMGPRDVMYDADGNPISIDGNPVPVIGGAVFTDAPFIDFPGVDLSNLREIAAAQGQVFSKTKHFTNETLEGVIYFEGSQCHPYFDDVCVKGVLVFDGVPEIRVEGGFFKIRSDDDILQNVALLAPQSTLWVDPNSTIDVYGLTLFNYADFQGKGTFTGPMVVINDLNTCPDSVLYCQFPSQMKENIDTGLIWNELMLVELEYEEM
jgi:hypothetical protein